MKTLLSSIALIFMMIFVPITQAHASAPAIPTTPCQYEDSTNCYWNAQTMGNGQGQSFYDVDGQTYYVDASQLPTTDVPTTDTTQGLDALAWDLFDATGASDLLPQTASTVTFTASASPDSPITPTADTIVCTDSLGNTYQFTIS